MIRICDVEKIDGTRGDFTFPSEEERLIAGSHLLALPALIDPHVHFRTPGFEYKEDWLSGARAVLRGGYTTVMDMPNTNPATVTLEYLQAKKQ